MRLMLWTTSFIILALWSLLVWGASGLVGMASLGLPAPAELLPGAFAAESWLTKLTLIGQGALLFVWALGAIVLMLCTAILSRTLRAAGRLFRGQAGSDLSGVLPYRRPSGLTRRLASRLVPRLLRAVHR